MSEKQSKVKRKTIDFSYLSSDVTSKFFDLLSKDCNIKKDVLINVVFTSFYLNFYTNMNNFLAGSQNKIDLPTATNACFSSFLEIYSKDFNEYQKFISEVHNAKTEK